VTVEHGYEERTIAQVRQFDDAAVRLLQHDRQLMHVESLHTFFALFPNGVEVPLHHVVLVVHGFQAPGRFHEHQSVHAISDMHPHRRSCAVVDVGTFGGDVSTAWIGGPVADPESLSEGAGDVARSMVVAITPRRASRMVLDNIELYIVNPSLMLRDSYPPPQPGLPSTRGPQRIGAYTPTNSAKALVQNRAANTMIEG